MLSLACFWIISTSPMLSNVQDTTKAATKRVLTTQKAQTKELQKNNTKLDSLLMQLKIDTTKAKKK